MARSPRYIGVICALSMSGGGTVIMSHIMFYCLKSIVLFSLCGFTNSFHSLWFRSLSTKVLSVFIRRSAPSQNTHKQKCPWLQSVKWSIGLVLRTKIRWHPHWEKSATFRVHLCAIVCFSLLLSYVEQRTHFVLSVPSLE